MSDAVNPDHYKRLPAEAIEIIEAMIAGAPDNKAAYLHGQGAKYDLRLWGKGKSLEDYLTDWQKHIWYALRLESHLLELIEKQKADEQQKEADLQSLKEHLFGKLKEPAWTPKIGDWVRIKKPSSDKRDSVLWSSFMDEHDKEVVQVKEIKDGAMVHGEWFFPFDWLEPAEQPKATLNSDTIPEGYRKLNDSSEEPRQVGDLRWSVSEKRYVEISVDEIGYANRDNWAACRKVESVIKQSLTTEPPDGWRFLEVGEVIREGDRYFDERKNEWENRVNCIGDKLDVFHKPTIRRNRFEVGEKVVYIQDESVWDYISEINDGPNYPKSAHVASGSTSLRVCVTRLAPYIEDAKPTVEVTGEVTEEVKPPDGWRFLEVGEVIRKGDEGIENGRFYAIEPIKIGMTLQAHWMPTIRRNRFEVGENVVDCRSGVVFTVQHFNKTHQIVFVDGVSDGIESKHFAPYIKDAK